MNKILLTGGSGLLGRKLQELFKRDRMEFLAPSHKEMEITSSVAVSEFVDSRLIVHCAAYTDVLMAQKERQRCYEVNVIGTRNLAYLCIPVVYISTDGVFDGTKGNYIEEDYPNPVNFYGLTKLLGEFEAAKTDCTIIRTSFKPSPFEHSSACTDMFTSGDYVDAIAEKILFVIKHRDRFPSIIHIGTGRKSVYDLAIKTRPKVRKITRSMINVPLPWDISLNTSLFDQTQVELAHLQHNV
jgi:dTDP-4-dehydrorhamnose reductase